MKICVFEWLTSVVKLCEIVRWCLIIIIHSQCIKINMALAPIFRIQPRQLLQPGINQIITIKLKMLLQLNFWLDLGLILKVISQCIHIQHIMYFINQVQIGQVMIIMVFHHKLFHHFCNRQDQWIMELEQLEVSWVSIKQHKIITWMWIMVNTSTMDCKVYRRHQIQYQLAVTQAVQEFHMAQLRLRWTHHVQLLWKVHTNGWRNHLTRVNQIQVIWIELFFFFFYLNILCCPFWPTRSSSIFQSSCTEMDHIHWNHKEKQTHKIFQFCLEFLSESLTWHEKQHEMKLRRSEWSLSASLMVLKIWSFHFSILQLFLTRLNRAEADWFTAREGRIWHFDGS